MAYTIVPMKNISYGYIKTNLSYHRQGKEHSPINRKYLGQDAKGV